MMQDQLKRTAVHFPPALSNKHWLHNMQHLKSHLMDFHNFSPQTHHLMHPLSDILLSVLYHWLFCFHQSRNTSLWLCVCVQRWSEGAFHYISAMDTDFYDGISHKGPTSAFWIGLTLESMKRRVCGLCVRTHSQQAVLVELGVGESVLQGQSVLLGDFLQSSGLALLHLAGLLFGSSSHVAHIFLVGRLLLTQGLMGKTR